MTAPTPTSTITKKTLLTLLQERDEILHSILENEGEITNQVSDLFDLNTEQLAEKVEAYIALIKLLEAEEIALKAEADAFYAKAKACSNLAKKIEDNAKHLMAFNGTTRLQGTKHDLVISKSKPALLVNEEVGFWEFTPFLKTHIEKTIDKEAIRSSLEAGHAVDGARLEERFRLTKPVRNLLKGKGHERDTNK